MVPFEKKIVHPKYGTEGNKHDIGLIKLKKPVELGPKVGLISFPYPKSADDKPVTAIGWGRIVSTAMVEFSKYINILKYKNL